MVLSFKTVVDFKPEEFAGKWYKLFRSKEIVFEEGICKIQYFEQLSDNKIQLLLSEEININEPANRETNPNKITLDINKGIASPVN